MCSDFPASVLSLFWLMPDGTYGNIQLFGETLTIVRIDSLSRIFGLIFHLAAIISAIYALHVRDTRQHVAALVYAGAAIGAACAGDLITLFVYLGTDGDLERISGLGQRQRAIVSVGHAISDHPSWIGRAAVVRGDR